MSANVWSLDFVAADAARAEVDRLGHPIAGRNPRRLLCQVLTERGRDVRVVNPLWTNRQRAFYGQDKDDANGRAIAAVVLRRRDQLPLASDFGQLAHFGASAAALFHRFEWFHLVSPQGETLHSPFHRNLLCCSTCCWSFRVSRAISQ
jgi:hypothetical protein